MCKATSYWEIEEIVRWLLFFFLYVGDDAAGLYDAGARRRSCLDKREGDGFIRVIEVWLSERHIFGDICTDSLVVSLFALLVRGNNYRWKYAYICVF